MFTGIGGKAPVYKNKENEDNKIIDFYNGLTYKTAKEKYNISNSFWKECVKE